MVAYDVRARARAARALASKTQGGSGQIVTLHQPATDGVYDPATDTVTGGSPPQDHEGSGVEEQYDEKRIDGTVILEGDVRFLLSPLKADGSLMPQPVPDTWTLEYEDGRTWTVKHVSPLGPAGNVVMYTLRLRGA